MLTNCYSQGVKRSVLNINTIFLKSLWRFSYVRCSHALKHSKNIIFYVVRYINRYVYMEHMRKLGYFCDMTHFEFILLTRSVLFTILDNI